MKVDDVNSQRLRSPAALASNGPGKDLFTQRRREHGENHLGSLRVSLRPCGRNYLNGSASSDAPVTASWAAARPQMAPITLPWPL